MKRVNFFLSLFSMMLLSQSSFALRGRGQEVVAGPKHPGVTANAGMKPGWQEPEQFWRRESVTGGGNPNAGRQCRWR